MERVSWDIHFLPTTELLSEAVIEGQGGESGLMLWAVMNREIKKYC